MKKSNLWVAIIVFVALMAAAVWAYQYLTANYRAPQLPSSSSSTIESSQSSGSEEASSESSSSEPEQIEAPDFAVEDANGNSVSLSDYKGKIVVVNFWASWCPPCKGELPDFNQVRTEYDEQEVVFLMVDMTDGVRETKEKALQFVEDNEYDFNLLFDIDSDAAYTYGISSIPSTVFVDADGMISAGYVGAISADTLRNEVDALLNP